MYFSFRGKVFIGPRTTGGNPGKMRWLGNMPDLTLSLATEEEQHTESYSGQDLTDEIIETARNASLSGTIENFDSDNVQLLTRSKKTAITGAAVTNEVLPTGLVAGDSVLLAHQGVSAFSLKDSAATPVTVNTVDYELRAAGGGLTMKSVGSYTQPFKADYTYSAAVQLALLSAAPIDQWLRFEGVNKKDLTPIIMDIYRIQAKPTSEFGLIHSAQGSWKLDAAALVDDKKAADGDLGQFGRIITLGS